MISRLLPFLLLLGLVTSALAQMPARPNVPEAIKAPADEQIVLVAHATGAQVYTCKSIEDGKFAWVLKAPDAQLHDDMGAVIGTHFAGPTWKLDDGSAVKGKAVAKVEQPDAIPWLLVNVVEHTGAGKLGSVNTIQRINTKNGLPPASGCDEPDLNHDIRSSYTADYYFYAPAK